MHPAASLLSLMDAAHLDCIAAAGSPALLRLVCTCLVDFPASLEATKPGEGWCKPALMWMEYCGYRACFFNEPAVVHVLVVCVLTCSSMLALCRGAWRLEQARHLHPNSL